MARLSYSYRFSLRPKAPYNFELTVRKPAGWDLFTPFEIYEEGVLWTALHLDSLLVGLRLRSDGATNSPRILVRAFLKTEPNFEEKQLVKETLVIKLGVNDDLAEFYSMARKDWILKHTIADLYGMHDTQASSLFGAAVLAICLQMAPLKRSNEMMECIISRYGELAEFDGRDVRVWPLSKSISRLRLKDFAEECKLGYRSKLIIKLAKALINEDFPSIEGLNQLPPDLAKRKLMELPGVGDYSSDIINPHGGFPIDAWSVDVFSKLFYGREPKDARRAIERVKAEGIRRWGRWSWMAFFYIAQDLENLSRKLKTRLRLT